MLNRSGITKTTATAPVQILANVDLQSSVGCMVPKSLGTVVGSSTIAKAGTPINIDLTNLQTPAKATAGTSGSEVPLNAILLHDVDVTAGTANGTALIFGFVNLNRLDSTTASALTTAAAIKGSSALLTLMKA